MYISFLGIYIQPTTTIAFAILAAYIFRNILIYPLMLIFAKKKNVYTNLILKKYTINKDNPARLISVEGVNAGLLARFLRLFGFGNRYRINVNQRFVNISLYNRTSADSFTIPITHISAIYYGYSRPRSALFVGIVIILLALLNLYDYLSFMRYYDPYHTYLLVNIIFPILLGCAFIFFVYWLGKRIEIRVSPGDGNWFGYSFIAGSAGTLEKARETALIIQNLIHASTANPNANETIL